MNGRLAAALALSTLLSPSLTGSAWAEVHTIKLATLAPEGSSWMHALRDWSNDVEAHSNHQLTVKLYAGGVAGDERDVVRKMRLGQINAAAVTAVGIGLIQPAVRVLELPMLMHDYAELDWVRSKLEPDFRKKFSEKGFVLLAWGDVGPVYIFSNTPIRSKADLLQTKMWAWVDDALVRELFGQLGVNGVPLGVPDVLPSLQTGLINACYGSPLSTLALQWYTKVHYMTSMPMTHAVAAVVMEKKLFDQLSPTEQRQLYADSALLQSRIIKQVRGDNDKALAQMKAAGLQVIPTPKEMVAEFERDAEAIRPKLEPAVYSKDFLIKVEKLLAEYRAGKR